MNFIGVSSRNYHDGDTTIDGKLTLTSGEINIPKYDTDIKELQDTTLLLNDRTTLLETKTEFQEIKEGKIVDNLLLTSQPKTNNKANTVAYGINFTPKTDIILKDVIIDTSYLYIQQYEPYNKRSVGLYTVSDEKFLKFVDYDVDLNNTILNFDYPLKKNVDYVLEIRATAQDFYSLNPTINNDDLVLYNGLTESTHQPYVYKFPNIPSTKWIGNNIIFERHYDQNINMSKDLYLENQKEESIFNLLYDTPYTGTVASVSDKRSWGYHFKVNKDNMRLRHLTVRGDLLLTTAITYYPTRNFHIYVQNDPNVNSYTLVKTVVMELKVITGNQNQRIDLDCDIEQGKDYIVAIDLLYEPNPNVANAFLKDKYGDQSPPTQNNYFDNIFQISTYSFHTPGYGVPLQQSFPITPFYLFNIEFEETNVLQTFKNDLYLNAITSNNKYHIFENPDASLEHGDLVCIRHTQGFSIEKTDVNNSYRKPIGIFDEHLDDNKCKILIKGEGYCKITGGCVAGDEMGLSTTDLGKCERYGNETFAISMEEIIAGSSDMVKLYLY